MNFYDDQATTTGQLFERFFPGRGDVVRLLMEPITYANGSTLEDPALTYGIVFSNFMSKGVYTFQGGTDRLIGLMERRAARKRRRRPHRDAGVEKIHVAGRRVEGVTVDGRHDQSPRGRLQRQSAGHDLQSRRRRSIGTRDFLEQARAVRLNNSSTQVYMALKPGDADRGEPMRRSAVQLDGPGVPHRYAAEPRHHQPDAFRSTIRKTRPGLRPLR